MAVAVTSTDHEVMVEAAVLRAAAHPFIQEEQTIFQLQLQLLQLLPDCRPQCLKLFCLLPETSQTPIEDVRIQVSHSSGRQQLYEFKVNTQNQCLQHCDHPVPIWWSLFFHIEKSLVHCKISTYVNYLNWLSFLLKWFELNELNFVLLNLMS